MGLELASRRWFNLACEQMLTRYTSEEHRLAAGVTTAVPELLLLLASPAFIGQDDADAHMLLRELTDSF